MFQIRQQELLNSIRQAALKNSADGVHILERENSNSPKNIHQLRVITKQLRSYWRIIQPLLENKAVYQAHNQELRDTAKSLSQSRESSVNRKLVNSFRSSVNKAEELVVLDALLNLIPIPLDTAQLNNKDSLITCFIEEHKFWQQLEVNDPKFIDKQVLGLIHTYKKARKLGNNAIEQKLEPEITHMWRKWAKYLFYQLEALPKKPDTKKTNNYLSTFECLTDALGKYHDLYVLQNMINDYESRKLLDVDTSVIFKLIHKKNKKLSKILSKYNKLVFDKKNIVTVVPGPLITVANSV